jgi:hypothetical protein
LPCRGAPQVCLDPLAVSSDPTSSYLMDGDVVTTWVASAFARAKASVARVLLPESGALAPGAASTLDVAAADVAGLRHVAEALAAGAPSSGGGGGAAAAATPATPGFSSAAAAAAAAASSPSARAHALCAELARWGQYTEALAWLARAALPRPRVEGFAWTQAVKRRRAAALPETLFLDDLLRGFGPDAPAYPPPSREAAAKAIFTAGAFTRAAHAPPLASTHPP